MYIWILLAKLYLGEQEAKQEAARNKRAKEKAMAEASAEMSLQIMPGQPSESTSPNKKTIETKVSERRHVILYNEAKLIK